MSRVAKDPIVLPGGVEASITGAELRVKGSKGQLSMTVNSAVAVTQEDGCLKFAPQGEAVGGWAQAGTARALANNLVQGVTQGFEKRLQLVGVGYRAQAQGRALNLSLGFSHPVVY
ncbi:MAG: 50S ribosomal protein L6, partial [Pseudomonadales bacterium]|nr:50S ribosomal protein L6 [Pseudomonadales bacterium]